MNSSLGGRVFFVLLAVGQIMSAQHDHGGAQSFFDEIFKDPLPLVSEALGNFTHPISSQNHEAQAYFDQGFQLMYAFDQSDAIRSFHEAEKRDPNCAICYWGEAWSWGSFLNGTMGSSQSPFAYAAVQKARELAAGHATDEERALIEAMSVRYVKNFDPAKKRDQDIAYSQAMQKVHERYPKDLDAGTLYGEALFLLEPRRGWRDIHSPNTQRIAQVFEFVLAIDSRHVGACHLYIHLMEATSEPEKAEACADSMGNAIPGASHINHMPSHIWNRVGRWGDSVRANLQAWHTDQKAEIGEAFSIYATHNLDMLSFAASWDGQGAIAMQAARDYDKMVGDHVHPILTFIRFGRFDEVLQMTNRPSKADPAAVWDFGQGYARLRKGDKEASRAALKRLLDTAATTTGSFRFTSAHHVLECLGGILEGEIDRSDGDLKKATAAFERAVIEQDALDYDEPEPLPFAARHWLGAALLEQKDYANAERVYREELQKHPHNGWSLFGLKAALEGQGKPSIDVEKEFAASWARSDTWIRASRF